MHIELPGLLRRSRPFDVVVEDLGHVAPFLAEHIVSSPGVVFFRHLHRRTLSEQVGPTAGALLEAAERSYPYLYHRWPLVGPTTGAVADLRALGFVTSRLRLIPYGVDSETFHPGTLDTTPSLIYFSGLRKYKRPDHALRVVQALREERLDARLTMVGRGPELSKLEALARNLKIEPYVTFTGWVPEGELAALVARSWIHIQCSRAEGWGLTASEAAASGVPTVAYRVPGLVDSVIPRVSGILVDDGSVSALTQASAEVIRTRLEWTARCRESVLGISWDAVAAHWEDLLVDISRPG